MSKSRWLLVFLACAFPAAAQEAPRLLWKLDLGAPSYGGAAAGDLDGDGRPEVVFGTYFGDERIRAVSGKDGKVLWSFRSEGGPFDASVLLVDTDGDGKLEALFADSSTGTLFCVRGKDGAVVWKFKGQNSTDSPPAAADLDGDGKLEIVYGTMMRGDGMGFVNALDAKTGTLRWSAKVRGHVQSQAVLADLDGDGRPDVVVATWTGDNSVHALSGKDGRPLWSFKTGDRMYHGPAVGDLDGDGKPELVFTSTDTHAYAVSAQGKLLWKRSFGKYPEVYLFGPVTLADLDGDGKLEVLVPGRDLYCLDARGEVRWTHRVGHQIARGCAVADVTGDGKLDVAFGAGDRTLRLVEGATGKEIWKAELRTGTHVHESVDHQPLVLDLDGDGRLDLFIVSGKGTYDRGGKHDNYGRAWAFAGGRGAGPGWTLFCGDPLRHGRFAPRRP